MGDAHMSIGSHRGRVGDDSDDLISLTSKYSHTEMLGRLQAAATLQLDVGHNSRFSAQIAFEP